MADFRKIEISDKEWVDEILKRAACESLENNFTTAYIWRKIYDLKISPLCGGDFFSTMTNKTEISFLPPSGSGDIKAAFEEIFDYCKKEGISPRFYSVTEKNREEMEKLFPDMFDFSQVRSAADYVYEAEKLKTLSGKKLAAKRNHINRFCENNPDWKYEEITRENIDEAYKMNEEWCAAVGCGEDRSLMEECCAVREAFAHFFELGLSGGLIRANGKVVAYSMGDRQSADTFLVHIEKAFPTVQGAYPIINREFVRHNCEGYTFVNREDDAGDEGLRRAKLSYRPAFLVTKYKAEMKND